jgi:GT2 family glycosyltransferase
MKKTNLAPVILFAYNRPHHTRLTIEALAANKLARNTKLIIFSDAEKNDNEKTAVEEVRRYLKTIRGFATLDIVERRRNLGLADSIISGVTQTVQEHGKVIVLEDDILTSPYFLQYMNDALVKYQHDERVMHIAAYMPPINTRGLPESFFLRQSSCWGWATWDRAWKYFHRNGKDYIRTFSKKDIRRFNLDGCYPYWDQLINNEEGRIKTWAIYWYASVFSRGGLCLHPRESLMQNIGFDGSGQNCIRSDKILCQLADKPVSEFPNRTNNFLENQIAITRFKHFFIIKSIEIKFYTFIKKIPKSFSKFTARLNLKNPRR